MKKSLRRGKSKLSEHWDSLLWMISMLATMYFTNFMSNILLNPLVHRGWQAVSVVSFSIAAVCIFKVARRSPRLELTDWDSSWPPTIGFISGVTGLVSFIVSVWSIWRYWTFAITSVIFMGFISFVSMI